MTHLYDIQACSSCASHVDGDRLDQSTLSKILDLLGHGGTEEKGLSLALQKARPRGGGAKLGIATLLCALPHPQEACLHAVGYWEYQEMGNETVYARQAWQPCVQVGFTAQNSAF